MSLISKIVQVSGNIYFRNGCMKFKGFGRKLLWPSPGTISTFYGRELSGTSPKYVFNGQRLNVHVLNEQQGFGITDLSCIGKVSACKF